MAAYNSWIVGTVLVLFALSGGGVGWWKGSRDLANPPEPYDRPFGVGRREYNRQMHKRYRWRRILHMVGGTLGMTALGFGLLVLISTGR